MDQHKKTLSEILNPYGTYNKTLKMIEKYNRADTTNMPEKEMNVFRHIAGPAYLTSGYYPPLFTKALGWGKEAKDLLVGRGLKDTQTDLTNNIKGINIGEANRNLKGNYKNLFDYIFETEIKPKRGQN